jgi:hypothetical protein
MKQAAVMALLLSTCTLALAEWVELGDTEEMVYYVDPTTIRKNGQFAKAWVLHHEKVQGTWNYRSAKAHEEYDCKEEATRMLYLVTFSGSMGNGRVVDNVPPTSSRWIPAMPRSAASIKLAFVCR